MNIHGIRTHPPGLYIFLSVPDVLPLSHVLLLYKTLSQVYFLLHWQPPALPCRLQQSTIGRLSLNRRVRDGNGCFPQAHRHQKSRVLNEYKIYRRTNLVNRTSL